MATVSKYLIRRGAQQYGPYTLDVLLHYYKQGQILGTDLVCTDGRETWITVAQLCVAISLGGESLGAAGPRDLTGTPRRRRLKLWMWGAGVAGVVATSVVLIVLLSGPKPEDSLDHARTAYLQRDQVSFDKYVDVTSVLSDSVDQIANVIMQQNDTSGLARLAIAAAVPTLKSIYLPSTAQAVDQFIISGTLPQDSQSTGRDPATALVAAYVSAALRRVAASSLSNQGIESKHVSGNSTTLDVRVATPVSSQPIVLKVRMQKSGDYWRVVAIEDLAALLRELGGRSAQGTPSTIPAAASPAPASPLAPATPSAPAPAPSAEADAPPVPEPAAVAPTTTAAQDATVPAPAVAAPDDDDPIGQGGFITPPTAPAPGDDPIDQGGFITPPAPQPTGTDPNL